MKKTLEKLLLPTVILLSITTLFFSWTSHTKIKTIGKESASLYKGFFGGTPVKEPEPPPLKSDPKLCKSLQRIPFAEDKGLLKNIRTVRIEGVQAPYNGSILENEKGYLMVFRYDVKIRKTFAGMNTPFRQKIPFHTQKMPFKTFLGSVQLDKQFNQIAPFKQIDTKSEFSEDPRIFTANGKLYLSYNDMQENEVYSRSMRLAELNPETMQPIFISDIDQHINHTEKNWVPFTLKEASGEERIYFGYGINPHKIMGMEDPESNQMKHPVFPHNVSLQKMPWPEKKWGVLRGGTPAILVDGQYLAFFHTLFYENKRPWYVMGAYTFESAPPYRVTSVSSEPIVFKGMYETPAVNTAHSKKKAIYPAGIVLGIEEGREVIHISCGENDSLNKILTFDKEALIKSLTPVVPYNPKKP